MIKQQKHVPTDREQAFLDSVENTQYKRESINGLFPFFNERAPDDIQGFYSPDEIDALRVVQETQREVEQRMPVK